MFGFQNGWNQFSDLSDKVQKLRTGLEAGLQDSGLLGPGETPAKHDEHCRGAADEGLPASGPADEEAGSAFVAQHHTASSSSAPGTVNDNHRDWNSLGKASTLAASEEAVHSDHGWDEHQLDMEEADGISEDGAAADTRQIPEEAAAVVPSPSASESRQTALEIQAYSPRGTAGSRESGSVLEAAAEGSRDRASSDNSPDSPEAPPDSAADRTAQPPGSPSVSANGDIGLDPEKERPPDAAEPEEGKVEEEVNPAADDSSPSDDPAESPSGPTEPIVESLKGRPEKAKSREEVLAMGLEELQEWCLQQQTALQARELQLERKFEEVASMQEVTQQLMARNEELAMKTAKASEEDIKQLTEEYEARLGASERKVYALTKEREMLRRGSEKLSSANDLLKEKDNIIAQVMAEGEQLSKKQLAQESTIKKLRQQLKEMEFSFKEVTSDVAVERKKLEDVLAAKQKSDHELAAARAAHKNELEAEKGHYESLLARARTAQVEAENKAAVSAKEGLSRRLKEAEMKAEMLADQVADLQMSLERQRSASDSREDRLKRELADMERRNQEAEARHEELTNKLPEATRPLLRQIEGMQRTAAAHSQAWQAAEAALQSRLQEAEARSAAAVEKERLATERLQAANSRASSLGAALDAVREECTELNARLESQRDELCSAKKRCSKLEEQSSQLLSKLEAVEGEKMELERSVESRLGESEKASMRMLAAAEARAANLEERLRRQDPRAASTPAGGEPPVMAGPGYKWVLLREGEDPQRQAEPGPSPRVSYANSLPRATAPELERLRDALLQKEEQLALCQDTILKLEETRDSLAEELVAMSQTSEQHADAWRDLQKAQSEHTQAQQKLAACTELLGEREEKILELTADVADMKALYREQIEYVLDLAAPSSHSRAASSVSSWVPGPER